MSEIISPGSNGSVARTGVLSEPNEMMEVVARAMRDPTVDINKFQVLVDVLNNQEDRAIKREEEARAREAKRAWAEAMNRVQGAIQQVVRDKDNPQTKSRYARLETIDAMARPIYTSHGFALSFSQEPADDKKEVRINCEVSHTGGLTKNYHLQSRLDNLGPQGTVNKTELHGLGSSISYLRRYLTTLIFNVVVADEDEDGNSNKVRGKRSSLRDTVMGNGEAKPVEWPGLAAALAALTKTPNGWAWSDALIELVALAATFDDAKGLADAAIVKRNRAVAPEEAKAKIDEAFHLAKVRLTAQAATEKAAAAKETEKKPAPAKAATETVPPIDDEPQSEHAFEAEPWNEFGDAAEFEDGRQARFTDPVEFARWFAEYLDTSDQPVRLLEYNSDIIDAASSHPEAAAIIVKARAAIDALDAEVAERAAAEEAAKAEWMSRVAVKVAIPDRSKFPWPKYLTGIIEALPAIKTKDALDEFVAIQDRYLNERLAFTETPTNKTWVGKIGLAIEAHRVELSKPPKVDQDQKRITDLVADLNKAETQVAYDLAVANAGRQRVQTIVAGRPDLLRLVNEAADAAKARIAKAQADQAPPQDDAPPNEGG